MTNTDEVTLTLSGAVENFGIVVARLRRARRLTQIDLATKSNVSLPYVRRIENGGVRQPSNQVVDSICRALSATKAESQYMRLLAAPTSATTEVCEPDREDSLFLDLLQPTLAAYLSPDWDVLAANRAYREAFPGLCDSVDDRPMTGRGNVIEWLILDPQAQRIMVEWEAETRLAVAWFRMTTTAHGFTKRSEAVFRKCFEDSTFRSFWECSDVTAERVRPTMVLRDENAKLTELRTTLWRSTLDSRGWTLFLGARTALKPE